LINTGVVGLKKALTAVAFSPVHDVDAGDDEVTFLRSSFSCTRYGTPLLKPHIDANDDGNDVGTEAARRSLDADVHSAFRQSIMAQQIHINIEVRFYQLLCK
jgi:hypothetical protein